jgi:hypothetical protein
MDETTLLKLPYIMAAQAQKHVTHNEAIRSLDALVQLSVLDRDLAAPPVSPVDGARYIVAASPTGAWAGQAGRIAAWQDGAWSFHVPREGWLCWIADETVPVVHSSGQWLALPPGAGASAMLNRSASSATNVMAVLEQELTLSGASVDSTTVIPSRAIVFAVSTRTTQAVSGAASYDCGIAGETSKYGDRSAQRWAAATPASPDPRHSTPRRPSASPPMAAASRAARSGSPSITCCAAPRRPDTRPHWTLIHQREGARQPCPARHPASSARAATPARI